MSVQVDAKDDDGGTDREPDKGLEWFQTFNDMGWAEFRFHVVYPR